MAMKKIVLILFITLPACSTVVPPEPVDIVDSGLTQTQQANLARATQARLENVEPMTFSSRITGPPPLPELRSASEIATAACTAFDGSWRCPGKKHATIFADSPTTGPIVPSSWTVPTWAVDFANTTGCASDQNSCTQTTCGGAGTNAGPCLSNAEIELHRWGTYAPSLPQNTTINALSNQSTSQRETDPFIFSGRLTGGTQGAQLTYLCAPTVVSTTTIASLTAKSRGTGVRLSVGLTAGGGLKLLYTNSTHPATAWAIASGGSGFFMNQPLNWSSSTSTVPVSAEVDTWATTDSITTSTLPTVNITQLTPQVDFQGTAESAIVVVKDCNILYGGTENDGDQPLVVGPFVELIDDYIQNEVIISGPAQASCEVCGSSNVYYKGGFSGGFYAAGASKVNGGVSGGLWTILGGTVAAGTTVQTVPVFSGVQLDGDVNLNTSSENFMGYNSGGLIEFGGTGNAKVGYGVLDLQTTALYAAGHILWGDNNTKGNLDSGNGKIVYPTGAGAGAATFGDINSVNLANANSACLSNPGASTTTSLCNITVAAGSDLDTNLGATVTGCLLSGPSGFCNTAL